MTTVVRPHGCPIGPSCRCHENTASRTDSVRELALAFLATATGWAEEVLDVVFTDPERAARYLAVAKIAFRAAQRVRRTIGSEIRP